MAELTKKLHFKKNGTEQTAKAYSTIDEAGENYSKLKIDGIACYAPIGNIDDAMATVGRVKSAVKYYKYIDVPWTQPVLTSDGTMGVSDFATSASSVVDSIRYAYRAFDGSNVDTETDCWHSASGTTGWLSWYSKTPIKIQTLTISNRDVYNGDVDTVHSPKGWELQTSNNGSSWSTIISGTNTNNAGYGTWNIVIPTESQAYSSYWRLNILSSNGTYLCIGEIKITATTQSIVEVSSNEPYDYTVGGDIFAIKSQSKHPYAEVSYTTAGTYTFTVPSGVTRMRVAVCGGGAGCVSAAFGNFRYGNAGNASSFGSLIQAAGGNGGRGYYDSEDTGEAYGGTGGSPNGRSGTAGSCYNGAYTVYGGAGFGLSFTLTSGSYGQGGGGSMTGASLGVAAGGGSGGYNSGYITVSPGTTYPITVGGGGAANYHKTKGYSLQAGNSGFVLIAYGGDI